jgi:glycosyltransferase involved in cell wall biosynthesis
MLLSVALRCFQHQSYGSRELIVVDDGRDFPVDPSAIEGVGGRLITVPTGTPLGIKLNLAAAAATGRYCMKMDDDDWYGPDYITTMLDALQASQRLVCRPTLLFLMGFLFFDLRTWELRQSVDRNVPGATLFFAKEDWKHRPFRPLLTDEDTWFIRDHVEAGGVVLPVQNALEMYVAIRHSGHTGGRAHTWAYQSDGQLLEDYLAGRPEYVKTPEDLLPPWVIEIYRQIHSEIAATASAR